MSGVNTNRTNITLPADIANEVIQKTQEGSLIFHADTIEDRFRNAADKTGYEVTACQRLFFLVS